MYEIDFFTVDDKSYFSFFCFLFNTYTDYINNKEVKPKNYGNK